MNLPVWAASATPEAVTQRQLDRCISDVYIRFEMSLNMFYLDVSNGRPDVRYKHYQ